MNVKDTDQYYTPVKIVADIISSIAPDDVWEDVTTTGEAADRFSELPIRSVPDVDARAFVTGYRGGYLWCNPPYSVESGGAPAFVRHLAPAYDVSVFLLNYDTWGPRIALDFAGGDYGFTHVYLGFFTKRLRFSEGSISAEAKKPSAKKPSAKRPSVLLVTSKTGAVNLPGTVGDIPVLWVPIHGVRTRVPLPPVHGLDVGIADTVNSLRSKGFMTCDSGDGVSKGEACVLPYPHVVIRTTRELAFDDGEDVLGELGDGWRVEVTYSPNDGVYTILAYMAPEPVAGVDY